MEATSSVGYHHTGKPLATLPLRREGRSYAPSGTHSYTGTCQAGTRYTDGWVRRLPDVVAILQLPPDGTNYTRRGCRAQENIMDILLFTKTPWLRETCAVMWTVYILTPWFLVTTHTTKQTTHLR